MKTFNKADKILLNSDTIKIDDHYDMYLRYSSFGEWDECWSYRDGTEQISKYAPDDEILSVSYTKLDKSEPDTYFDITFTVAEINAAKIKDNVISITKDGITHNLHCYKLTKTKTK